MPARIVKVLYDDSLAANPAGTGTVARSLLPALQKTPGVEVVVSRMESTSLASVDVARKRVGRRVLRAFGHLRYFALDLEARAQRSGCDVIYSPSGLGPLRGRIPAVITVHDLTTERFPETVDRLSRIYLREMLRLQLRRSAAICTDTHAIANELVKRFPSLDPRRVHVIPIAPDPTLMSATAAPVDAAGGPFFLMVGTIEPRKNHITAIRAFAHYLRQRPGAPDLLVVAGSPGWLYQPVLDEIARLGLEARVRRVGRVDAGRLQWLYRHARALLFPSLYEGFGIPVLEAFALGCPVIAAAIPSVIEVAGDATATLLDPLDVEAWAMAIQVAASASRDEGKLAAALVRARAFSWEASAQALREALLEVATRARAAS
jgi:glycosyltransferase involved in cell wall biosynthesis